MGDSVTKLALVPREMTNSGIPVNRWWHLCWKQKQNYFKQKQGPKDSPQKGVMCRGTGLLTFRNLLRSLIEPVSRGKKDEPPIRELLTM